MLREESQLLQEPGSYVGEVVKVMGKNKVLVKVQYLFFLFNASQYTFYYAMSWSVLY
jgi:ATP-dependent 26S proteasome regulatory subunit